MAEHNDLGKAGENKAAGYLKSQGHHILARNWRSESYEVDIISRKDGTVVITEVKTRKKPVDDNADLMPHIKEGALREAADRYMQTLPDDDSLECRVDLLIIEKEGGKFTYRHIERAIEP